MPNLKQKSILVTAAGATILVAICLLLLSQILPVAAARRPTQDSTTPNAQQEDEIQAPSKPIQPDSISVIDFGKLAEEDARASRLPQTNGKPILKEIHPPKTITEKEDLTDQSLSLAAPPQEVGGPLIPSPAPSQSFLAQEDSPGVGTGGMSIPPDTTGAVGLDKVFVTLNNNYRVENKSTGAVLSTVSQSTFWSSTGGTGVFDPRVQYDPYNNRWIVAAMSNGNSANSSVLVGISNTSDPQGAFTLYRFTVGCAAGAANCDANGEWADFPMLGFNKNWIAVGWNQFPITGNNLVAGKMLILDYPSLRTGTTNSVISTVTTPGIDFCMHPATTLSPTEDTLYVPVHVSSANALYRLHKITGTPSAPVFTLSTISKTRPGGGWTPTGGDTLPQTCVGTPGTTCPTTPRLIDSGDVFIRSNVVFRNGNIWYAQTVGLPAGGPISHTAVQWTRIDTSGNFVDGGRVSDSSATPSTGEWYAYGSIGVNANNDVLLGFSNFSATHFARAAYAFHAGTDAAGTMRDPVVAKEGEDYYSKAFSGTLNRWGDYSHTVVDPSNDLDMWTVQEYAGLRTVQDSQTTTNSSRWGTWWVKVSNIGGPPPTPTPTPTPPANDNFANGQTISGCTGSVNGTNNFATRESGEPSHDPSDTTSLSPSASVWYKWQAPSSGSTTITTEGSDFDTILAVSTGSVVSSLTQITFNDDVQSGVITTSTVTFNATAGTTYRIAVDGWGSNTGNIKLNWSEVNCVSTPTVRLTATDYPISENSANGFVTVSVIREGDATSAASVNFATSDTSSLNSTCAQVTGKASDRCDYATSLGTLNWAAGEAGTKTFNIPIINDAIVEGTETFNVTLSSPIGVSLGTSAATVTILDNDSNPPGPNPIDGVDFFITQQYIDFLGRMPDQGGFTNWQNTLAPCPNGGFGENLNPSCDRIHVAAGFFQSDEFLNRGYWAFCFYMVSYNQRPTYAQFIPDMAQVGGPKSPAEEQASKSAFSDAYVQRPEFLAKYPGLSGQPLANALLQTAGLPNSTFTVTAGMTNAQILRGIVETSAAFNKFLTDGTVAIQYFGFLRRDPDTIGYQNNLATLRSDPNNLRHMIFIFIYSTEYRGRFGTP